MKTYIKYGGLIIAGGLVLFAFEDPYSAVAMFIATVLINIGVDEITLAREKRKGEIS